MCLLTVHVFCSCTCIVLASITYPNLFGLYLTLGAHAQEGYSTCLVGVGVGGWVGRFVSVCLLQL